MKLGKPYGIILLVLIALIILAILFPPFQTKASYINPGEFRGHWYLFDKDLNALTPKWDWVLAEVIVLVLLAAGAAVAVKKAKAWAKAP